MTAGTMCVSNGVAAVLHQVVCIINMNLKISFSILISLARREIYISNNNLDPIMRNDEIMNFNFNHMIDLGAFMSIWPLPMTMLDIIVKSNMFCATKMAQVSNVQCVTRRSRREIIRCVRGIITKDYLGIFIHGNDICTCVRICHFVDPGKAWMVLWCKW